jgi:hypothetical protein
MAEDGKPKARQYDQVAVNSIWREHCKKELSILSNFHLHNEKKSKKTTKNKKTAQYKKNFTSP